MQDDTAKSMEDIKDSKEQEVTTKKEPMKNKVKSVIENVDMEERKDFIKRLLKTKVLRFEG